MRKNVERKNLWAVEQTGKKQNKLIKIIFFILMNNTNKQLSTLILQLWVVTIYWFLGLVALSFDLRCIDELHTTCVHSDLRYSKERSKGFLKIITVDEIFEFLLGALPAWVGGDFCYWLIESLGIVNTWSHYIFATFTSVSQCVDFECILVGEKNVVFEDLFFSKFFVLPQRISWGCSWKWHQFVYCHNRPIFHLWLDRPCHPYCHQGI